MLNHTQPRCVLSSYIYIYSVFQEGVIDTSFSCNHPLDASPTTKTVSGFTDCSRVFPHTLNQSFSAIKDLLLTRKTRLILCDSPEKRAGNSLVVLIRVNGFDRAKIEFCKNLEIVKVSGLHCVMTVSNSSPFKKKFPSEILSPPETRL